MMSAVKLPPRKKLWGYVYGKNAQWCMTGKEWQQYAGTDSWFKYRDSDAATCGKGVEVYLDGSPAPGLPREEERA